MKVVSLINVQTVGVELRIIPIIYSVQCVCQTFPIDPTSLCQMGGNWIIGGI